MRCPGSNPGCCSRNINPADMGRRSFLTTRCLFFPFHDTLTRAYTPWLSPYTRIISATARGSLQTPSPATAYVAATAVPRLLASPTGARDHPSAILFRARRKPPPPGHREPPLMPCNGVLRIRKLSPFVLGACYSQRCSFPAPSAYQYSEDMQTLASASGFLFHRGPF